MNEYIEFNNESIVESYIDSVYQEANEASKKLRKTTDQFLKDNYTDTDLKKMTPKQRNRVKKFLKDSDYDPKTNTIATDIVDKSGKPVRVKFTTKGFEGFSPDEPGGTLAPELVKQTNLDMLKKIGYTFDPDDTKKAVDKALADKGYDQPMIHMGNQWLKRKPYIAQGLRKHEEGHVDKWLHTKAGDYDHSHTGKIERPARKLLKSKEYYLHDHDENPEEYYADLYSVNHNKYQKNAMRFLNTLNSKDKLIRSKLKKQIFAQPKLSSMTADKNLYSLKIQLETLIHDMEEIMKEYGKNMKPDGVAVFNQQINIYKRCLSDIEKLHDVDYEKGVAAMDEAQRRALQLNLNDILKKLDNGAKLRKQFVQNMVKEFYTIPDELMDVIQEMCDPWDTIQSMILETSYDESSIDAFII